MTGSRPRRPRRFRDLRRAGPLIVVSLILLLGGLSVWQAWSIAGHLRDDARDTSRIYGRIVAALAEPDAGASAQILLEIVRDIAASGLPVIVTDSLQRPTAAMNLPFGDVPLDDPRVVEFAGTLDRVNPPLTGPDMGQIHFGPLPLARPLTWLAILQVALLLTTTAVALWASRVAVDRNRERLWVAMARESAHQLGTPLMSARAWIDRLGMLPGGGAADIADHLAADMDRMQRVVQRFERIGRPARSERVALGALAERVAAYFGPRLPQLANRVLIDVRAPAAGPVVQGDPVLLEWALEALVRNAIDALSGRGGDITITVEPDETSASVTVADDGPGVALDIRDTLFEPGVTTKQGGWGIGLALVRRIVEEVHGGRLELLTTTPGAAFRAVLPTEPDA
jgi:signal transduction histidine kinase